MNKTLLLAAAGAVVVTAVSAQAVELQQYVSLKGNYAKLDGDFKAGDYKASADDKVLGASVAYGVKLSDIRAELEGNLNGDASKKFVDVEGDPTKATVKTESLFLNAYYDIPTGMAVKPYVGAGIGYARLKGKLKWEDESLTIKKNKLAYQVGAGVSYELTQNWAIDAGYRYIDYGKFTKRDEDGEKMKWTADSHNFYLGVRFTF